MKNSLVSRSFLLGSCVGGVIVIFCCMQASPADDRQIERLQAQITNLQINVGKLADDNFGHKIHIQNLQQVVGDLQQRMSKK